jgi:hypothetical protein
MKTKRVKFYLETTIDVQIPDKPSDAIEDDSEWETSMIGQKGEELAFALDGSATLDRWVVKD